MRLNQQNADAAEGPIVRQDMTRRIFVGSLAGAAAQVLLPAGARESRAKPDSTGAAGMTDAITNEKIRRARLSGPPQITANATVAEMDGAGSLTILSKGTNDWVCCPG